MIVVSRCGKKLGCTVCGARLWVGDDVEGVTLTRKRLVMSTLHADCEAVGDRALARQMILDRKRRALLLASEARRRVRGLEAAA